MKAHNRDHRMKVPADVLALIDRANRGEAEALWELQKVFDKDPRLVAWAGDLCGLAALKAAELAAGDKALAVNDAALRHLEAVEADLGAEGETALEKLLARRLAICALWAGVADLRLAAAERAAGPLAEARLREALHRADRAQARLLATAKTLAQVRQLCRPPKSPLTVYMAAETAAAKAEPARFRRPASSAPELIPADVNWPAPRLIRTGPGWAGFSVTANRAAGIDCRTSGTPGRRR